MELDILYIYILYTMAPWRIGESKFWFSHISQTLCNLQIWIKYHKKGLFIALLLVYVV